MNNNKVFNQLPTVFQTVTQRKFFDSTFEQLFSKKNSEKIDGYIGRRTSGLYDPKNDYYIPQKNKERTWYQLEPSTVVSNPETAEKSNYYFYYDLINRINSLGGDTSNNDRLFQSNQYAYGPPIDMDKFVNFQNYYWVPARFDPVEFANISDDFVEKQILGNTRFVASGYNEFVGTDLESLVFTTGMRVTFPDSDSYNTPLTILGVGDAITLVKDELEILPAVTYNLLPWDGDATVGTVSLNNALWDGIPWDAIERETTLADYITIGKGALNSNLWSRTNKWFHVSAIEETIRFTGKDFPVTADRARRPIIEFFADTQLDNSGIFFYNEIDFYQTKLTYNEVNFQSLGQVRTLLGSNNVKNGTRILFANDTEVFQGVGSVANTVVWQVFILNGIVQLVPSNYEVVRPISIELFYNILPWDAANAEVDNTLWDSLAWAATELGELGVRRLLKEGGNFVYDNATVTLPSVLDFPIGTEIRVRISAGTDATIEAFAQNEFLFDLNGFQTTSIAYGDENADIGFILTQQGWESFTIVSYTDVAQVDDIVFVASGDFPADGGNLGQSYYYNGDVWVASANQKVRQNQTPKFALYDNEKVALADVNKYPDSNFAGSDIFSYKVSDEPDVSIDPILGLPLVYKSFSQSSDVVFENDLISERYTYVQTDNGIVEVPGYYYYRIVDRNDNRIDSTRWNFNNGWYLQSRPTRQRVVDKVAVFDSTVNEYQLSVTPLRGRSSIDLLINGTNIEDFDYFVQNGAPWIRINRTLAVNDDIEAKTYSREALDKNEPGFYEIPKELESNPENAEPFEYAYGEFIPHFTSIIFNQAGNQEVNPRSRDNTYRDTARDPSVGNLIVQTDSSLLKSMLFSDPRDVDVISAIRYARNEYVNFRSAFISEASRYKYDFAQEDNFTLYNWVSEILEASGLARTAGAFENSYMVAFGDPATEEQLDVFAQRNNGNGDSILLSNVGPGQFRTILDAELPGIKYDYNKLELFDNTASRTLVIGLDYSVERTERSAIIRFSETSSVSADGLISVDLLSTGAQLTSSITDVTQQNNILYVYEVGSDFEQNPETSQRILLESKDFFVRYEDGLINIDFAYDLEYPRNDKLYYARVFTDSDPAYIPSTPSSLGMSKVNVPRLEIDSSYTLEQTVIVGHDGSRTIAYGNYERDVNNDLVVDQNGAPYPAGLDISGGVDNIPLAELIKYYDIRDLLLLELEKQIYNNIPSKFKTEYDLLLKVSDVRPSALAVGDYTREEYYPLITESLFSKWTAANQLDFRANDFYNEFDWRTYNYSSLNAKFWNQSTNEIVESTSGKLPGSWKGIYVYYYGTVEPHSKPWECLGFAEQPEWWFSTSEAGFDDGFTGYGNNFSATNTALWADIEQGIIRRGPRSGVLPVEQRRLGLLGNSDFDRLTYFQTLPNGTETFRAPYNGVAGTDNLIPVRDNGEKKPILDIFGYSFSDIVNPTGEWVYGDGGPVENAWYRSPEYAFSVLEFFYMLKPAAFGEKFWDPESIDFVGDQFIDTRTGFRPVNSTQLVHGEVIDGETIVRSGYQQYISDYLKFNNVDVTVNVGDKVRGLGVELAHKVGGFTDRDRLKLYLESVSNVDQDSLLIPSSNFDVALYTGAPIKSYTYSGVLVKVNNDSSFSVYGYDLISQEFKVLPAKSNTRQVRVSEGGTPETFVEFEFGRRYNEGQIARYEGNFYRARTSLLADSFVSTDWIRLAGLPTQGGISVLYQPDRQEDFKRVAYSTRLNTAQDVYDFLIGYGAFLESDGWKYETVDIYGKVDNWRTAADKFLFWAANNWEEGNALALSPNSTNISLEVEDGYPDNVERLTNGVYSILDKDGFSIPPENTIIQRDGKNISVSPVNATEGVFYFRVNAIETEHIVVIDKLTDFNDVVYDPILNTRQSRLRFSGIRTLGWTGKLEAPGYLVQGKDLLPNLDSIVENVRTLYDENTVNDNEDLEDAARHLIGYENRAYLDALNVTDQAQFNFYQGFVTEKGTANAIDKLLRSSTLEDKDKINFFEDWAFKSSDFGASTNNISVEILSERSKIKSDPQTYRLNFSLRDTGSITSVAIYSAEEIYNTVPTVTIAPPELAGGIQARAIAILNNARTIERIEIVNIGTGYSSRPVVTIGDGTGTDIAYATVQRKVTPDSALDQIIDIDSDDTTRWLTKPTGVNFENSVPTVANVTDGLPTAGYVHKDDVEYSVYSDITIPWTRRLDARPSTHDTIWIASTENNDWAVYKVVNRGLALTSADEATFDLDASNPFFEFFDASSFAFNKKRYPDCKFDKPDGSADYVISEFTIAVELINPAGTLVGQTADKFLAICKRVNIGTDVVPEYEYRLFDLEGEPLPRTVFEYSDGVDYEDRYSTFVNARFSSVDQFNAFDTIELFEHVPTDNNNLVWLDNNGSNQWEVRQLILPSKPEDDNITASDTFRKQQLLINTSLYDNVYLRERVSGKTIAQIPVYDPVKGILFGSVEKNVSYKTPSDPAKYVTGGNTGRTFGDNEVGKVWLDTSTIKFIDYEQPPKYQGLLTDRTSAVNDAIVYRRDNWGKVFAGSPISVYEWVASETPPSGYRGNGTPKNLNDFVEVRKYNSAEDEFEVKYYFWVIGKTEFPSTAKNRTMSTTEITNTIRNPGKQGIRWFAPVQFTSTSQSFVIANSGSLLSNQDCVVQLNYRQNESVNVKHDEWLLLRENDRFSKIPDRLWDKMVNSLIGFTQPLPAGDYENGIPVSETEIILPVPNPSLSVDQKYGLGIRPQQSMFVDSTEARRIIVEKTNTLISGLRFWETPILGWDNDITSSEYWEYVDWYDTGYNRLNTRTNRQVETLQELLNSLDTLEDGDLIRVYPFNPNLLVDKYEVYVYDGSINNVRLIRRQEGVARFKDSIVDNQYSGTAKRELREVLTALKENVFVSAREVLQNTLFFTAVNFVLSEQKQVDWVFKTTYLTFVQDGIQLKQDKFFKPDQFDNFLDYVREAKPYHSKIRDSIVIITYTSPNELANGTAFDNFIGDYACENGVCAGSVDVFLRTMKVSIEFSRFGENSLLIDPNSSGSADLARAWDKVGTEWDQEAFLWDQSLVIGGIIDAGTEYGDDPSVYPTTVYSSEPATDELVYIDPAETLIIDTFTPVSESANEYWDLNTWDGPVGWGEKPDTSVFQDVAYKLHIRKYGIEFGEFTANAAGTSAELLSYLPPTRFVPRIVVDGDGTGAEVYIDSISDSGEILALDVAVIGEGYTTATATIDHPSGTGFSATLTISSGSIVDYTITSPGTGYSLFFDNGQVNTIEITKEPSFLSVSIDNQMWIDSELITYTNVVDNGNTLILTGIQRGQKGTGVHEHTPGTTIFTGSDFIPDPLLSNLGVPGADALLTNDDQVATIIRRFDNRQVKIPNCNPWFRRSTENTSVFIANSAAANYLYANGTGTYPGFG